MAAIVRWCNLVTDIEDRKQAEDLLRSSERQFHAILDNIPALVAIHNASGELELYNRAALEYHGRCVADLKQWKTTDVVHPDDLPALIAALQRAFATGQPLEPSTACGARTARIGGSTAGRPVER